jgi:hypothetical protein
VGKRANQAIWDMFKPDNEPDDEPEYPPEEDWEAGFSDWKHNRDDDKAVPVRHVRLFDGCGRVR